jgi:hypothetical protein
LPASSVLTVGGNALTKNRRVSLYIYSKVDGGWKYRPAPERPKNLPEGSSLVIMWYEGEDANRKARKRSLNVGRLADVAKVELQRKKAGLLTRIVEGRETPEPAPKAKPEPPTPAASTVKDAVKKYLEECADRIGQDGYGFSNNSFKAGRHLSSPEHGFLATRCGCQRHRL